MSRRFPADLLPFLLTSGAVVLLGACCLFLQWPRSVVPGDALPSVFSGQRAVGSLVRIMDAAGGPHAVGTAANARVHEEIVRQLEDLGWRVERQRGVGCRSLRTCAAVENLVAHLPGRGGGPAVVVSTHTDSVPAAPGAGDDGAGIAVSLELARNLAALPPLERPVWLLLNEGEEMGLLGAEHFVRGLAGQEEVGAVINLEARGTEGPVWFFEVSEGGGGLVSAYGRSVPHPTTSSIAYAVYRRMPNDTDLTVYKGAGLPGLGLAFIDGGARYHTPMDDLAHLSAATVQRMGDSALALVLELAGSELPLPPSEWIFFDIAGLVTVRWPAAGSLPLALLAVLVIFGALRRGGQPPAGEMLRGAIAWLGGVAAGGVAGYLVYFLLVSLGALPMAFPENLPWATASAAAFGIAGTLGVGALGGRTQPRSALYGGLLALASIGVLVAILEPVACYPWVVAALGGGLAGLANGRRRGELAAGRGTEAVVATLASALLMVSLVPLIRVLPVGIGPIGLVASALLCGLVVSPLVCLLPASSSRRLPFWGLAALGLGLAAVTVATPAVTEDSPRPLSLSFFLDAESRESRVLLRTRGDVPAEMAGQLEIEAFERPVGEGVWPSVPAADPGFARLEMTVLERSENLLRVHLRSPRSAWSMVVLPPSGTAITAVTWPGLEPRRSEEGVGFLRLQAVAPEGVEVELKGELQGELHVIDRGLGLPPEAGDVLAARPPWLVPIGLGDHTDVWSSWQLESLQPEPEPEPEPELEPEPDSGQGD